MTAEDLPTPKPERVYTDEEREKIIASTHLVGRLLRERWLVFDEIQIERELRTKVVQFLLTALAVSGLYGASMGAFSVPDHPSQILISAIKVPVLLVGGMLFCLPALFVFNVLLGSKMTLNQVLALTTMSVAVMAIVLGAFAPITIFCVMSGASYDLMVVENVFAFSVAGFFGLEYLWQATRRIAVARSGERDLTILGIWIVIYCLLTSQLAWTMRPFIGAPDHELVLFRGLGGSFFDAVWQSMERLLS